jgi:hypothetical protein
MNPWLQKHIDNNFRDFEGLSVSGHIPVKDQVLNELLSDALRQAQSSEPKPTDPADKVDIRPFLKLLKKAEVRAVNGAIVLDFQIGV